MTISSGWKFVLFSLMPFVASGDWLGFRGDSSGATSDSVSLPQSIGDITWQIAMPGRSVAGPIIVGDMVVTTSSAGPDGEDLFLTGVAIEGGEIRFEIPLKATGRPFHHVSSACAAPTPVSDGETIVALFSSGDLLAVRADGEFLWTRSLGIDYPSAGNDIGLAASPVIADGTVVVSIESAGDSYAAGIDLATSQTKWRIDRPKKSNWSTPVVMKRPSGQTEVILTSAESVIAVDPQTGSVRWELPIECPTITSAVAIDGMLLIPADELTAFRYDEVDGVPQEIWREQKLSPDSPSVVVGGDRLYVLKGSMLVAGSLTDGSVLWRHRLRDFGKSWATPLLASDKLIVCDQSGTAIVVEDLGDEAKEFARFDMGDKVSASPATADGHVIIRGETILFGF